MKVSPERFVARVIIRMLWPFIGKHRPLPWKDPPPLSEIESAKFLAEVEATVNLILTRNATELAAAPPPLDLGGL
jgi:hypothetical protein